ncbi:MAG TPA: AsmA family protein [Candidatus Omnitrophota bacterium]|nr:AsmA family protein [Candidatus Omnitrophota bacterium]HPT07823.1 AsmA family protein [Candidatus Omnitrophota bacterium]
MKKIAIVLCALGIIISAVVVYVNNTVLPTKVKTLIIKSLQERTGKSVRLDSLSLNIFKGFVLRNLTIYDQTRTFISLEECDCTFLFWPFFKKQIIIPSVKIKHPVMYLQRRSDGSFNVADFLQPQKIPQAAAQPPFDILLYKVNISNGRINFEDDAVSPSFVKTIDDVNVAVTLSLPKGIQFRFMAQLAGDQKMKVSGTGSYTLKTKELSSHVTVSGLRPKEFASYYAAYGLLVLDGTVDVSADVRWSNTTVSVDMHDRLKGISVTKDAIQYCVDASAQAQTTMDFVKKDLLYTGNITVERGDILGLAPCGTISAVNGVLRFDNDGVSTDMAHAVIKGIPFEIKGNLSDFANPVIDTTFQANTSLQKLQQAMRDIFNISVPASCQGGAHLFVDAQAHAGVNAPIQYQGYIDVAGGNVSFERVPAAVRRIDGRIDFTENDVSWKNLSFTYNNTTYATNGTVTGLKSPVIKFDAASEEFSTNTTVSVYDKGVKISSCAGTYLNSTFSLTGDAHFFEGYKPTVEMGGAFLVDLTDVPGLFPQSKEFFKQVNPKGIIHGKFTVQGDISNVTSCDVQAQLTSDSIGAYNLSGTDFFMTYVQAQGAVTVPVMRISLYDGSIDGSAKLDLAHKDLPYSLNLNIQDVRIEKLKLDTAAKDKDISGLIRAQMSFTGAGSDLSALSGEGKAFIKDGRLWELNLFKGLGALIFTKDFARIVFHEGVCSFVLHDKTIMTDDLILHGNLADILGAVHVDFDGALGGQLQVNILDEMAPLSGTFRDVTTASVGQAGRFGTIMLSGTIMDPKFKFKTAVGVMTILRGLTDALFRGDPAQ